MKKKEEVYKDIESYFGFVPGFMKLIPENTLEQEWELFKKLQIEESTIPNKYKELIGLGINAVTKCRYCTLYHTEMARAYGATDEEIEEAVHYAKGSAGWSAYINGMQYDYGKFKDEIDKAIKYAKEHGAKKAA
ncbi:MAG: carboxymuconolactone decarboxylase family protein [Nitrospirota bacterium]